MAKRNRQRSRPRAVLPGAEQYPSAQTLYRLALLDERGKELFEQTSAQITDEDVLSRDAPAIAKIKAAHSPAELLDLLPVSTGLAEPAWMEQMRRLRLGAAPLIAERLTAAAALDDHKMRSLTEERLVAALYICGGLGIEQLLGCFDALSLYGKSLACLALGKAKARHAADRIWAYYERVKNYTLERFLIGPLWALVDLQDPRAAGALAELLAAGQEFYELGGLLALAGDRQAVWPLLDRFLETSGDERDDCVYALAAIGQRIGRPAFRAELEKAVAQKDKATLPDKMADAFLAYSAEAIQDHFELFYGYVSAPL
jgi:hypothetical protein